MDRPIRDWSAPRAATDPQRHAQSATGWQPETFTAPEAEVDLRSVKHALRLADIYENAL